MPVSQDMYRKAMFSIHITLTRERLGRLRVKLILRRHKYPPDMEHRAVELVLKQAEALSEVWVAS